MIILFSAGQLGNQIFQYVYAESLCKNNEKIITSFCEYFDIFKYDERKYVFVNKYIRFVLRRFLTVLIKLRVVTYIKQKQKIYKGYIVDVDDILFKKGIFSNIKVVDGFFQSEKFVKFQPKIKEIYIKKAKEFLADVAEKDYKLIFVHIRRGDYLDWSILGKKDPSLSVEYYKKQIDYFLVKLNNPFFIFLSNDDSFVENKFGYLKNKKISKNSVGVDIAIMSLCEYAIVSNSTLSWWGANLMKKRQIVFAPKYWLGWKSGVWFPNGIELSFVNFIEAIK